MAQAGQLVPAWELRAADFARHLTLSAGERTARSYVDALRRLVAFGADPQKAKRADLERFLARPRLGRHGDWHGRLSASTQTTLTARSPAAFTCGVDLSPALPSKGPGKQPPDSAVD